MSVATPLHTSVNIKERRNLQIKAGDTVRVWQKIQEKDKVRLQAFEGVVLAHKHGSEPGATFTVRRVVSGVGVEKIFPLFSPMIDKIEIVRRSKVRRSKLYHIRDKAMSQIRRQMRKMSQVEISTTSDMEEKEKAEAEMSAEISDEKIGDVEEVANETQESALDTEDAREEEPEEVEEKDTSSDEGTADEKKEGAEE